MRFLRTLGVVAAAAMVLWSSPAAFAGAEPVEPEVPTVLDATSEEVAKVLAAVEKSKADKDDKLFLSYLISMETHKADEFQPVIKDAMKSKEAKVQAAAIRAAASHEMSDEAKNVLKILKKSKKKKKGKDGGDVSGHVSAACIQFLARLAIEGAEEEVVEHLTRVFLVETRMQAAWAPDLVGGAVHYLGQMKTMSAVPQLVEMVKEPYPENPNSPSNPPASYWEARYKIWQATEGWVRWALKEITGQEFRTHREWAAYVSANKKKFK
jgi:hypothetical protein